MLTKAEDALIERMSFKDYMKFAQWIVNQKNSTCRSNPDETTFGYRCKQDGGKTPS